MATDRMQVQVISHSKPQRTQPVMEFAILLGTPVRGMLELLLLIKQWGKYIFW